MDQHTPFTRHAIIREFLVAEMWHGLGSYLPACERYSSLRESLRSLEIRTLRGDGESPSDPLAEVLESAWHLNAGLRDNVHRTRAASDQVLFPEAIARLRNRDENLWAPMLRFYDLLTAAAECVSRPVSQKRNPSLDGSHLRELAALIRIPGRWQSREEGWLTFERRLKQQSATFRRVHERLGEQAAAFRADSTGDLGDVASGMALPADVSIIARRWPRTDPSASSDTTLEDASALCSADLGPEQYRHHENVHMLTALGLAHEVLHAAEAERSGTVAHTLQAVARGYRITETDLDACTAIFTWVYNVAQTVPWCLAANSAERNRLQLELRDRSQSFLSESHPISHPAIWLADQISILAIFRRAATYQALRRHEEAFCDYTKVQRLARTSLRHLDRVAIEIEDSKEFLKIALALSEYRIGQLYRDDHAHPMALEYFGSAQEQFDQLWHDREDTPARVHSRWLIRLLLDRGESFAKLGRMKSTLESFIRAWEALVRLVGARSGRAPRFETSTRLVQWLSTRRNDPKIAKPELIELVVGLLGTIHATQIPPALHGLAAEVLLDLGRALGMLRLGSTAPGSAHGVPGSAIGATPREESGLAIAFLRKALEYRRSDALARTLLLSLAGGNGVSAEAVDTPKERGEQSIRGSDPVEGAIGLYEQGAIVSLIASSQPAVTAGRRGDTARDEGEQSKVLAARYLLAEVFRHPESAMARFDRVSRVLTRAPRNECVRLPEPDSASSYSLEFISCERYSSFGPFVPRPTAFASPGGGHFVLVHGRPVGPPRVHAHTGSSTDNRAFGIVFDPGPMFLRNFHQCGFSVADIDMIVVTHDHPDHTASLDAILTLLHQREKVLAGKFQSTEGRIHRRLPIICNESVKERYKGYAHYPVLFQTFDKISEMFYVDEVHLPRFGLDLPGLVEAEFLSAYPMPGHTDGGLTASFAFIVGHLSTGPTIGFTGDTPLGQVADLYQDPAWCALRRTHVLVANLGSLTIPRLLRTARIPPPYDGPEDLWASLGLPRSKPSPPAESPIASVTHAIRHAFADPTNSGGRQLYFDGMWELAVAYKETTQFPPVQRMLVISELREEMGSARVKVAAAINKFVFETDAMIKAFTADIGMRVFIDARGARGLCSTCVLNNDYSNEDRFHLPGRLFEVCVKGEGDAVFYSCTHHDPRNAAFLERMQRYNPYATHVFGRG